MRKVERSAMNKFRVLSIDGRIAVMCLALFAQQPPDAGGRRGGARGERGGIGPTPVPTGPVANATNAIIAAINTQDAAFFRTALNGDAWAAFNYRLDDASAQGQSVQGSGTIVYSKSGA